MSILSVNDLRKSYTKKNEVVSGVSFSVDQGEIFSFLGPNGAGKTTTIKMIVGLIAPDSGQIFIEGKVRERGAKGLAKIGSVLEGNRNTYWRMTVVENLVYFGVHKGLSYKEAKKSASNLIGMFNLCDKKNTQVQHLSRGMQQKVAIAISMIHKPKLLILDEPTLGLDISTTLDVERIMKELVSDGMSIVLTTHQLDVAQKLSDRVAIINQGKIIREQSKVDLIRDFTEDAYRIELTHELSKMNEMKVLECKDVMVKEKTISVRGGSIELFRVLEKIKPVEIKLVEKIELDLTQIFLKLTSGEVK